MTDMIPAGITPEEEKKAREWADDVLEGRAAAIVPIEETIARALRAYLPPPPRPTLADMPYEGRKECRWMQADSKPTGSRVVILEPNWTVGAARVLRETGRAIEARADALTPRPDLPRMEWPSTGQDGEEATKVDYVSVAGGRTAYGPWTVARLRKKPAPAPAPPNTLAVGSAWGDIDALALACESSGRDQIVVADCEGDVFVWGAGAGWWETGTPSDGYEPYTILYAGKGGDQ